MDKADPNTTTELQDCVVNFLARYRSTPYSVTNQSPSELLNGRRIRTRLDFLHPCQPLLSKSVLRQKVYYDSHTKPKQFLVGESVWIRNFRAGKQWLPGTIKGRIGNVMYKVAIEGSTVMWRRHANQLKVRSVILPDSSNNNSNSSTSTTNTAEPPAPLMLRRSTRIRRPRIPWSPSN